MYAPSGRTVMPEQGRPPRPRAERLRSLRSRRRPADQGADATSTTFALRVFGSERGKERAAAGPPSARAAAGGTRLVEPGPPTLPVRRGPGRAPPVVRALARTNPMCRPRSGGSVSCAPLRVPLCLRRFVASQDREYQAVLSAAAPDDVLDHGRAGAGRHDQPGSASLRHKSRGRGTVHPDLTGASPRPRERAVSHGSAAATAQSPSASPCTAVSSPRVRMIATRAGRHMVGPTPIGY
ncbi:hypothetical protein SPRI_1943 [Streptomyces pristinaespiralis]|uniref:Uncharacterized protein n=1 Tax=Streptomyces pristinaespiralis TaxID=38300 RepID=A0A0M3QHR9_STRPR|nr:hypothetical protein SPRI_1943 [Streptomyces pristinaespiralis]